jgi:predicted O-methyltransferase YrrM
MENRTMFAYDMHDMARDIELVRVATLLNTLPGFLAIQEGVALMSLAASVPGPPSIVEVGSFKGKSTSFLAAGCLFAGHGHVYAVDHFRGSLEHQKGGIEETREIVNAGTTLPEFQRNITTLGLRGYITERIGASSDMAKDWDKPIRLLFIDGDHSYAGTSADFNTWYPFLDDGAILCMHDYQNHHYLDGVTRFIDDVLLQMPELQHLTRVHSMMVFRKHSATAVLS